MFSFEYPQHMFWLRNKKNDFCSLIWGPVYSGKISDSTYISPPYLPSADNIFKRKIPRLYTLYEQLFTYMDSDTANFIACSKVSTVASQ